MAKNKYDKYIFPAIFSLLAAVIVFYLQANLEEQIKINDKLQNVNIQISTLSPILQRVVQDVERHDMQIDRLNIAVVKKCNAVC
jgi:hypothetical protein